MIRDQLIEKAAFVKVRDRLLEEEEDLTFEKATLLASRIEDAARDSAAIVAAAGSAADAVSGGLSTAPMNGEGQAAHGVGQVQTRPGKGNKGNSKCGNCSFATHRGSTYPASRQTCRKCGKTGHFGRCCRAKGQSQVQGIDCEDDDEMLFLEAARINVVGDQRCPVQYKRCDCELAGVRVTPVRDLGAKVSVISKASYDQWFHWC
jgi:hypothetical protein